MDRLKRRASWTASTATDEPDRVHGVEDIVKREFAFEKDSGYGGSISSKSRPPSNRSSFSISSLRTSTRSSRSSQEYILDLANPNRPNSPSPRPAARVQKHPANFQCHLCTKSFTRGYNLRSHIRTHTDEGPFVCAVCGKGFGRLYDCSRHEGLHSDENIFECKGELKSSPGTIWGCGRGFARIVALGRHFRSDAGQICLRPLFDEERNSKHEVKTGTFPPGLLARYPDLEGLDYGEGTDSDDEEGYLPDRPQITPYATLQKSLTMGPPGAPMNVPEIMVAEGTTAARDRSDSSMVYAKSGMIPEPHAVESLGLMQTPDFWKDEGYHTRQPSSHYDPVCNDDFSPYLDSSSSLFSLDPDSLPIVAYSTTIPPELSMEYGNLDSFAHVSPLGMPVPQQQQGQQQKQQQQQQQLVCNQPNFLTEPKGGVSSTISNSELVNIPIEYFETFTQPFKTASDFPGDGGLAITMHKQNLEYPSIPNADMVNGLQGLSLLRSFPGHTRKCSAHNSISSIGEMSFVGSLDSDEAAELWERELPSGLRAVRDKLVDQLLDLYKDTLAKDSDEQPLECGDTSSSSQTTSGTNSSSDGGATNSSATSLGKRVRDDGEVNSDDVQSPDHKKKRTQASLISLDGRLLACPYNKMDPSRYSEVNMEEKNYRGCSSCYLTTISRLKQHLYRVHKRPDHYCVCCFKVFRSRDILDAHARNRPACEVQEPQFDEKMSVDQVTLIRRRVVGQDQSETWFAIFEILFPRAVRPPSAYADSVSPELVQRFVDHFNRQARSRLLDLIRIQLGERMIMDSDQQRILDSALEIALAQLVSATDPMQDHSESQSSVTSPEQNSSPPPLQANSMNRYPAAAVLEAQPPHIVLTSPTLRETRSSHETFSQWAHQLEPFALQQHYLFHTSFDDQYPSSNTLVDYTDISLPDLPENAFFNNDL